MKLRLLPAVLTLSGASLVGIAVHEAYREHAYDDGVGVQTIGFGTTRHADGRPVRPGDRMSVERALIRLNADAQQMQQAMRQCIGPVPLYQHEWDAYVSLTYNIGSSAFCRSTLVRRLRETPPNYRAACNEILRWNQGGGQVMRGLVKRRQAEHAQCLGPAAAAAPTPAPAAAPAAPGARP